MCRHTGSRFDTEDPEKLFSTWLPRAEVPGGRIISDLLGDSAAFLCEGMSTCKPRQAHGLAGRRPAMARYHCVGTSIGRLAVHQLPICCRACPQAGNLDEAQSHDARAAAVWSTVRRGNTEAMSYLQKEAGYARFSDYRDFAGRDKYELGTWKDADDWVTGTSVKLLIGTRGYPGRHAHNLVLNLVQAQPSGKWEGSTSGVSTGVQHTAAMYGRVEIEKTAFPRAWIGLDATARRQRARNRRHEPGPHGPVFSRSLHCQAQPDALKPVSAKAQRWCCTSVQENLCGNTSLLGTGRPFPSISNMPTTVASARKSLGR